MDSKRHPAAIRRERRAVSDDSRLTFIQMRECEVTSRQTSSASTLQINKNERTTVLGIRRDDHKM